MLVYLCPLLPNPYRKEFPVAVANTGSGQNTLSLEICRKQFIVWVQDRWHRRNRIQGVRDSLEWSKTNSTKFFHRSSSKVCKNGRKLIVTKKCRFDTCQSKRGLNHGRHFGKIFASGRYTFVFRQLFLNHINFFLLVLFLTGLEF